MGRKEPANINNGGKKKDAQERVSCFEVPVQPFPTGRLGGGAQGRIAALLCGIADANQEAVQ